jgi:hypothetical protein
MTILERKPLFIVTTPYAPTAAVVCYQDTWETHIPAVRRLDPGVQQVVVRTLSQPSVIVTGTTNPGYVAFVNQTDVTPNSGSPFVVFVDPKAVNWLNKPMPAVASIGHRRDFRDITGHDVLWLPLQAK